MLTDDELYALLKSVQYKDWRMHLSTGVTGATAFKAHIAVRCARKRDGTYANLTLHFDLPKRGFRKKEAFVKWVFSKILWFEKHEAAEWFHFQNRRVFNPHRKKRPQIIKEKVA